MRFGSFQDVLLENHQRLSKRYFAGQHTGSRTGETSFRFGSCLGSCVERCGEAEQEYSASDTYMGLLP
jgi:hypothetical protein